MPHSVYFLKYTNANQEPLSGICQIKHLGSQESCTYGSKTFIYHINAEKDINI